MASRILVPFDNNPISYSIKTSAYTVPAGKYAYLINESPNISINGVNLYQTISMSVASSGVNTTEITGYGFYKAVYLSSGTVGAGCVVGNTSGGLAWGSSLTRQTTSPIINHGWSPFITATGPNCSSGPMGTGFSNSGGELFIWCSVGPNNNSANASATVYVMNHDPYGEWIPSGTVINSARYKLIEYNVIS